MIGSLGDILFRVSPESILTPRGITRSGSARDAVHEPHGYKPRPEHIGPGQDEMSFEIHIDRRSGSEQIEPIKEVERLRKYRDEGKPLVLIFGERPQGKWTIGALSEDWRSLTHKGLVDRITVSITLKEWH